MYESDSNMGVGRVTRPQTMKVWDIAVRLFHWSLVAAIACEFAFRAGTAIHNSVGYIVLGLIAFRLLWGFAGTSHARFADFVKSPTETLAYVWSILRGHPPRYVGHNPAGGAMVLALIAMAALTAGSGFAMTTDALWGEEWIEELHEGVANFTLVLIVAHVLGVIVASWQHRENLVKAIITGRKEL